MIRVRMCRGYRISVQRLKRLCLLMVYPFTLYSQLVQDIFVLCNISLALLVLSVTTKPPNASDIVDLLIPVIDSVKDKRVFEEEWFAQGLHKVQTYTYTIPLDCRVETAKALLKRIEGQTVTIFFIPFATSDDEWL